LVDGWCFRLDRLDTEKDTCAVVAIPGLALNVDGSFHGTKACVAVEGDPGVESTGEPLELAIKAKDVDHLFRISMITSGTGDKG
jgi:hypothetical protein